MSDALVEDDGIAGDKMIDPENLLFLEYRQILT